VGGYLARGGPGARTGYPRARARARGILAPGPGAQYGNNTKWAHPALLSWG